MYLLVLILPGSVYFAVGKIVIHSKCIKCDQNTSLFTNKNIVYTLSV